MLTHDLECLFAQVQLVAGKGRRRDARLCIMSFVALLAGERHTDAPVTASPFIRHFAIALNDAMSDAERQKLKLFAPRLIGTNDGLDEQRAKFVRHFFQAEIVPRINEDCAAGLLPSQIGRYRTTGFEVGSSPMLDELFESLNFGLNLDSSSACNQAAATAARILVDCAVSSVNKADRDWYWAKALDLLDRMSDLGSDQPSRVDANRVAATRMLAQARCSETLLPVIERVLHAVKWRLSQGNASGCSDPAPDPTNVAASASIATVGS